MIPTYQVWLWDHGSIGKVTSESSDVGCNMAIGNGFIVYVTRNYEVMNYVDLDHPQNLHLLTKQVKSDDSSRMDGNGVVFHAQNKANSQWSVHYAFLNQPDVSIAAADISCDKASPVEGGLGQCYGRIEESERLRGFRRRDSSTIRR